MYEETLMSLSQNDTTVRDNGFVRGALPRANADGASRTVLPGIDRGGGCEYYVWDKCISGILRTEFR